MRKLFVVGIVVLLVIAGAIDAYHERQLWKLKNEFSRCMAELGDLNHDGVVDLNEQVLFTKKFLSDNGLTMIQVNVKIADLGMRDQPVFNENGTKLSNRELINIVRDYRERSR